LRRGGRHGRAEKIVVGPDGKVIGRDKESGAVGCAAACVGDRDRTEPPQERRDVAGQDLGGDLLIVLKGRQGLGALDEIAADRRAGGARGQGKGLRPRQETGGQQAEQPGGAKAHPAFEP
jgi:hypothetical protein